MSAKHDPFVQGLRSGPRHLSEDITNMDVTQVGCVEIEKTK